MIKKPIPKSIPVFDVRYKILIIEELTYEGKRVDGLHEPIEKTIKIDKELTLERKWHVLLHELGHAFVYRCSIDEADDFSLNTEHQFVEANAKFMMRFLPMFERL